jgi:hypothetical protein
VNISSFHAAGNQACTEEKLHTWVNEYFIVGLNPVSEKYFYDRIHVLYGSSSASSWKQAKKCLKFGTCCVNKVQFLLRRLLRIRRVRSNKIKFVSITELCVSRL